MGVQQRQGESRTVAGAQFSPLVAYLGGPFGKQAFGVAAEVVFTHEHMDDTARGGRLGLLVDRHVNPSAELPCDVFVTRQTPAEDVQRDGPYLSLAVQPPVPDGDPVGGELYEPDAEEAPHVREWDFLKEHSEQALDEAGVSDAAPDADKARALTEYVMHFRTGPTYPSFHPVDVLLHSSYCSGGASLLCAMADVEGIPSRQCCISNHTMVEVLFDGRWHFVDNMPGGPRLIAGSDYVDVTLDPDRFAQLSDVQKGFVGHRRAWARSPWHYSGMLRWHWAWGGAIGRAVRTSVMDAYGISVPCDPHHARALYPGRDRHPFPMWDGVPEITLTEKASWLRVELRVRPGESVLKSFYAGPSDDNPVRRARVDWWFRGEVALGDVVLTCADGRSISPAELVPGTGDVTKVRFELPRDVVAAPGEHDLVLTNRSKRTLAAVAYPTPLLTPPAVGTRGALTIYQQATAVEPTVF